MIEVKGLVKTYGNKRAVDGITFTVKRGEILGFLGPNGAGKSTTMKMITGFIRPDAGTATVGGIDVAADPVGVKRQLGYLPESAPAYPEMTVEEFLRFIAEIRGFRATGEKRARVEHVLGLTHLTSVRTQTIETPSKGYKQRVGLAMTLIAKPEILILDEPTVGLDPKQITDIRDLIVRLGKDRTVILSSHILPEVAATCQRILIINQGQIVADGKLDKLSMGFDGSRRLAVRLVGSAEEGEALLGPLDGVTAVRFEGNLEEGTSDFFVETAEGADVRRAVFQACVQANRPLLSMRMANRTLEEIFLESTSLTREEV